MTIFDGYLMVDWSSTNKPNTGKDSIWIGHFERGVGLHGSMNPATRDQACKQVREVLARYVEEKRRVLVGFDFAYGYPAGTALNLKLPGEKPWLETWRLLASRIEDASNNRSNRFTAAAKLNELYSGDAFPFWGCPSTQACELLSSRKHRPPAASELPEFRICERGSGAKSVWQLSYAGSVGSQVLVGLPRLLALYEDAEFKAHSLVWPFDTGLTDPNDWSDDSWLICHAEIYPSVIPVTPRPGQVMDEAQVEQLAEFFKGCDDDGKLGELFRGQKKPRYEELSPVEAEEGWILGV